MAKKSYKTVCIGAGPAGLTAAYYLSLSNQSVLVLEKDPKYVGGISKTVEYKGYRFDIGGHRFFSKSAEVEDFWSMILGSDMLERPRSSRIYYNRKFFSYPLKAFEALIRLGPIETIRCLASFFYAKAFPIPNPKSFEQWVRNQFGRRLFEIFFKSYTEKVWGMKCSEISADWAAQRIKGLSLGQAVLNALTPKFLRKTDIKTLIESFRYPRLGPGMMWEKTRDRIVELGGIVEMGAEPISLQAKTPEFPFWTVKYKDLNGEIQEVRAENVISSAPMTELTNMLQPAARSLTASAKLKYRDFLVVALIVKERNIFSDNWIYVHDAKVHVGRIQSFKSWSPELVPDPNFNCLGLEYFCNEGDHLWAMEDEKLKALATKELLALGLAQPGDITDGYVIRQHKAYPVYDDVYQGAVDQIRTEIAQRYEGLHLVGRNGMHKYNNQDHAMMTAMLVAKNIIAGKNLFDPWQVNQDAEYHEEKRESVSTSGERMVPRNVTWTN